MAAMEVEQGSSKRDDQLLASLSKVLEEQGYPWDMKGGSLPLTHSLKELLVSKTVELEATTNMSISALFSLASDSKPSDIVESFEKFSKFCVECPGNGRSEVARVMYPVFVHFYIHLFSQGHHEQAKLLGEKFSGSFDPTQQAELSEIFSASSVEEFLSFEVVKKFREQKYFVRITEDAFLLLMEFIRALHTPFLLTIIERYLAIEVYGNVPVTATETAKLEPKKAPTFIKPRVPQLDENRLQAKLKLPANVQSASFSPSLPAKVTSPAQLTKISEFKEALATAELADPTPPSIAMYCIHSTDNTVHCASLSSTSKQYACGFADSSIHVWSRLPDGAYSSTNSHMTRVQPVGLPSASSDDGHQALVGHSGPVYGTCFSTDGRFLVSGGEDSTTRLWDLEKGENVVRYLGHAYPVWDVSFSPIDVYFASASMDRTARLWVCDLAYPLRIFAGHTSSVNVVRFHPNGQYVATGSYDRTCRLWDLNSGQCVRLMRGCKSAVTSIAFSPNGKQLISGGVDGVVRVWELGSGEVIREYSPPTQHSNRGPVSSVAFSSDSTLLATSSHLNCVNVYNMKKSTLSPPPSTKEESLLSLSVSPKSCSILHLQFTHRNCVVGIAKLDNSTTGLDHHPFN